MHRVVAAVVACLAWTGAAAAKDWIAQGSPAEGWTGARTCVPGGGVTALRLSLGFTTRRGPTATLSLSDVPQAAEVAATILVDGALAGGLDFQPDASGIT